MFQQNTKRNDARDESEPQESGSNAKRLFHRKVPHAVFDDPRLDLRSFGLLMQRARHADNFALNRVHLQKEVGLGSDGFYAGLASLKSLGYLSRWQDRDENGFDYCVETINLAAAPISMRKSFEILRPNVPGLDWRAQALLDFLFSHAPTYPFRARNLAERFGVCERTIRRHLRALGKRGLVELVVEHHAGGRFGRQGYVAVRESSATEDRPDKNRKQDSRRSDICRTHKSRMDKNRTYNKEETFNKDDLSNKDQEATLRERASRENARCRRHTLRVEGKDKRRRPKPGFADMFRSMTEEQERMVRFMLENERGVSDAIDDTDYADDDKLRRLLVDRLHGQIGRALLSTQGIDQFRWLIGAHAYYTGRVLADEEDVVEATQSLVLHYLYYFTLPINKAWLNTWAFLALRMAGDSYANTGPYADFDARAAYERQEHEEADNKDEFADVPF